MGSCLLHYYTMKKVDINQQGNVLSHDLCSYTQSNESLFASMGNTGCNEMPFITYGDHSVL